jgi:hypothetical protein
MSIFSRRSPPPPTRDELVEKLDSLRPGPGGARHLAPEDVTGVIDLALERLQAAQEHGSVALLAATERLLEESEATCALAKRLSDRPPA